MRRCKKCMHKISFWKYLTVWRPVLPLFPRTQMPPVCSPSRAPCRGFLKVSSCTDWLNLCRGRWQGLLFIRSVVSDSLQPHGLQHARPPCPSPPPGTCSNSCPSSQWCHPTLSSSVVPFSRLQSFPASGSFPMGRSPHQVATGICGWQCTGSLPHRVPRDDESQDWRKGSQLQEEKAGQEGGKTKGGDFCQVPASTRSL